MGRVGVGRKGTIGVGSGRNRSVALERGQLEDRNPESVADARLLAQLMGEQGDEGWLNPSQKESLRTAVDIVRPMQLRDLGMAGLMGMLPLPVPGGKAGRTVAGGVARGVGRMDDVARGLVNFLRRGDDVIDDVADLVQPTLPGLGRAGGAATGAGSGGRPTIPMRSGRNTVAAPGSPAQELFPPHVEGLAATGRGPDRPQFRMNAEAAAEGTRLREMVRDPTIRSRWWKEATESATPIKVGEDAAQLPHGARVNLDEVLEYGGEGLGSRTIVQVRLADGTTQPFYSSTGINSGQRGGWFPLDGIQTAPVDMGRGWFIKQEGHPNLTGELAEIAQALKAHATLGRIRPTQFFGRSTAAGATNEIETINVLLGRTGKVGG